MIRMEGVSKFYPTPAGRKYVLRDVSLALPECNIGIIGGNGAGKSTLLRLLGGIDHPNAGRIVSRKSISWPLGLRGGYQGSLTGRDNARFVCRIYGSGEREIARKLAFIHEFSELGEYFDMPVSSYSTGMRARLGFATSMAFDFEIYLLDEITAVGDQAFRKKSRTALAAKKNGAYVIKATHNLKELLRDCQAGVVLANGEARLFHDIEEAVTAYRSRRAA